MSIGCYPDLSTDKPSSIIVVIADLERRVAMAVELDLRAARELATVLTEAAEEAGRFQEIFDARETARRQR
jgi:hypothetical protein